MRMQGNRRPPRGFTLIEMLVVVVIIGVLASIVGPRFFGKADEAKIAAAKSQLEVFALALDSYQLDTGDYPSQEQGLKALVEKPSSGTVPKGWNGPYLRKRELPKDPWGNDYGYVKPGKHNPDYDLYSLGKSGKPGGDGENANITNW
ncbi:general secretion pathway protein G [Solidesulfovibrio carbinoliphilus subsp. oakridgensis]|uniref:Type II secretion system core protein G n=1 Tax=Solidesulfovibrio carbinoliphilus subsp. oakridgensis TaxID=694327 RepID=G7Q649_9BACT|nr:type II secretion system major pseudopilin GspG [Solidesulfovibrio carbinoliphilus]EHJ47065.1 general secretion pathway protein G [Solidesulfovibrio carbinoliphilus subsp. oakridgensis]